MTEYKENKRGGRDAPDAYTNADNVLKEIVELSRPIAAYLRDNAITPDTVIITAFDVRLTSEYGSTLLK